MHFNPNKLTSFMRAQEAVPPRPLLGEPIGAPVTANTFVKCRYAQGSPAYQVTQNTQLTQHHKLPAQSALVSQVLPRQQQQQQQLQQMQQLHLQQQQQQQRHYQLMKPSTLMSQKHQEQQHAALATQFVSCAGHRSRSNSSLASQEKRSPSQLSSSCEGLLHSSTKAGGSMRCGYSGETRAVPFNSCAFNNRLSFGSTRSSLGSGQQFSSLRYVSTDSEHNVSAAVASDAAAVTDEPAEATGVPPVPASVSPVCGAAPSSGLSVGGESCTDWGVISAENGNSNNDNSSSTSGSNVFVAVRVRPLSESERRQGDSKSVSVVAPQSLLVTERGAGGGPRGRRVRRRCFLFDSVFGESAGQEEVFQLSTSPLLQELFKGTNVSIFAYGATAAGKTYTMLGTETRPGVMPRALQLLFQQVSSEQEKEYVFICRFVEIYNETIRDLLGHRGEVCELREDPERGVLLQHATSLRLCSPQQALLLLLEGNARRTQEATNANQTSSRSHAVLQVRRTAISPCSPGACSVLYASFLQLRRPGSPKKPAIQQSTDVAS